SVIVGRVRCLPQQGDTARVIGSMRVRMGGKDSILVATRNAMVLASRPIVRAPVECMDHSGQRSAHLLQVASSFSPQESGATQLARPTSRPQWSLQLQQ